MRILSEPELLDELARRLLRVVDSMVLWGDPSIPDDVRKNKWQIMAKRLMAASGADLQEFIQNVVRDIAGDKVRTSRELGQEISDLLLMARKAGGDSRLIRYVKRRAFPLVLRYMASAGESGGE